MSSPRWELQPNRARLSIGPLTADVSPASPTDGISRIEWQGQPIRACQLLEVRSPSCAPNCPPLLEAYVRGNDLVATYGKAERGAVQPHVYWRAMEGEQNSAAGVQLIISMQTDELDSQPESLITSRLQARELFVLDRVSEHVPEPLPLSALPAQFAGSAGHAASLFLFRLADTGVSYAEMVHPGDFVSAALETPGPATDDGVVSCSLTWRLFPESLEKGVIRRSRMAGWLLPTENDVAHAAELFRQFVEAPLPLTA